MADSGTEPGCVLVVRTSSTSWILPAILAALVVTGAASAAFFAGLALAFQHDPALLVVAFSLSALAALTVWWAWAMFRARLEVYEWGFLRRHSFGTTRLPFADVDTILLPGAAAIGLEPLARSTWKAGSTKVGLGLMPQAETLKAANFALQRVVPRLVRVAEAELKAGGERRFGNARATWNGLTIGQSTFRWAEIDAMNFSPEGLRVFPVNRPEATAILPLRTPNLHLLINLARARLADASTAAATTSAPPPAYTGAPAERVSGYPDVDAELGNVVCGQSRAKALVAIVVGFAVLAGLGAFTAMLHWALALVVEIAVIAFGIRQAMRAGFAVYERGARFPSGSLRFDETEHVTYSVVDQYTNGAYTGRQVAIVVEGKNGVKLSFNGSGAKNEAICNAIADRALPSLCERRWKEIQAGGSLTVDKITLKRNAVVFKKEEVLLPNLLTAEPRKGFLHVWRRDKETTWASASLAAKDGRVLAHLVDRMFRERDAAAQQSAAAR